MVTPSQQVMPNNSAVENWKKMVQAALMNRNKFPPGSPEYKKWNNLYVARSKQLSKISNPQNTNQTTVNNPVSNKITPIINTTPPPPVTTSPTANTTPTTSPPVTVGGEQTQTTTVEPTTTYNPENPELKVADDASKREYEYNVYKTDLENKFNYYKVNKDYDQFTETLQKSIDQMRLDYKLQNRQLDNESAQILGDLENRAKELANQLQLGMSDIDAQVAISELQSQVQQQLGMRGLDVDFAKSMAQTEAATRTGLTQLILDQEKAAGDISLQRQLGMAGMAADLSKNLASNKSNERMAAINAAGQVMPQMRQISSNERQNFAGMGANLAQNQMGVNAQRENSLMNMGVQGRQGIRNSETQRQLGLTDQAVRAYQTMAQMNQQPENWLSAFYAMRGMNVPQSARTGAAQSLGQFTQQLGQAGLNIDPMKAASNDNMLNRAFDKGYGINPNDLNGDVGTLINNYNNAAFQGLGAEREQAQHQTGKLFDLAEYNRGVDTDMMKKLAGNFTQESLAKTNTLGQVGYDPTASRKYLNNQLNETDYYKQNKWDQGWNKGSNGFDPYQADYDPYKAGSTNNTQPSNNMPLPPTNNIPPSNLPNAGYAPNPANLGIAPVETTTDFNPKGWNGNSYQGDYDPYKAGSTNNTRPSSTTSDLPNAGWDSDTSWAPNTSWDTSWKTSWLNDQPLPSTIE